VSNASRKVPAAMSTAEMTESLPDEKIDCDNIRTHHKR
jgi:hypothetical protein